MDDDPRSLLAAVCRAVDRDMDATDRADLLILQKGCFILNFWGYGPVFDFNLIIKGPYSQDLREICEDLGEIEASWETDVTDEDIQKLRGIIGKGVDYLEAYSMVLIVVSYNPEISESEAHEFVEEVVPRLKKQFDEVFASLSGSDIWTQTSEDVSGLS